MKNQTQREIHPSRILKTINFLTDKGFKVIRMVGMKKVFNTNNKNFLIILHAMNKTIF